jgi:hypothetical protein
MIGNDTSPSNDVLGYNDYAHKLFVQNPRTSFYHGRDVEATSRYKQHSSLT